VTPGSYVLAHSPLTGSGCLESLRAGRHFPAWTIDDLADIVPAMADRVALIQSLRPRGWDFFNEPLPPLDAWPDAVRISTDLPGVRLLGATRLVSSVGRSFVATLATSLPSLVLGPL
jgi:hypothetical protein